MSFLQPLLLLGLPLAALPIIIHLIHLHRRRTVKWAAMMFLLMAQRMNKGFSRLRQILILAMRVLAVMALIFLVSRPLAGGWLGLTGGAPDTVLILLDRSASMEQINPVSGMSKRRTGLEKLSAGIKQAYGSRSRLVLLDSALQQTLPLERADALLDLPQTEATDTGADIPAMLQSALDYITANKTGRTDLWLLSDLKQSDWDASGGRWESLRGAFASLRGVRFHLLSYPQPAVENLTISVENITRRESSERAEILMDVRITRNETSPQPLEVPLRFVINGASSTEKVTLRDNQILLQAHAIPLDKAMKRGWGRVELPADSFGPDNVFHFVFDEPAALRSVIVSDDASEVEPLRAVLESALDTSRRYACTVLPVSRAAEIPWDETALLVWHAPLPEPESITARQLENQIAAGRSVLFLPTENPGSAALFGFHWGAWRTSADAKPDIVQWWRNDSGLLANTRAGNALPVGDLEVSRRCEIVGDGVPLARLASGEPLLVRASGTRSGGIYFLGTMPGSG
ncbi:MAG: BatA domain-containing protein, partial [Verrucomicrobiaceae bacterium]